MSTQPIPGTDLVVEIQKGKPITVGGQQALTRDESRMVALALEVAIKAGKLKPFEALQVGAKLDAPLAPWVQRQHDHYVSTNKKREA